MKATSLAMFLLPFAAGCSTDRGTDEAMRTFQAFQKALLRQDESTCRELLTLDSAQALAEMPWRKLAAREPLRVAGARREYDGIHVEVRDPNRGGVAGEYVVVREHGRLVVDLVASAGLTARVVEADGSPEVLEPRELTPADWDRIRRYELTQPPR